MPTEGLLCLACLLMILLMLCDWLIGWKYLPYFQKIKIQAKETWKERSKELRWQSTVMTIRLSESCWKSSTNWRSEHRLQGQPIPSMLFTEFFNSDQRGRIFRHMCSACSCLTSV